MSGFPEDRSFSYGMAEELLFCAGDFWVNNRLVPYEELISSDTLLGHLGTALQKRKWPLRTPQELRQELERLRVRWEEFSRKGLARPIHNLSPSLWMDFSDYEDNDFVSPPPRVSKRAQGASSSSNRGGGSKAKSDEDDDDDFMPPPEVSKRVEGASNKSKRAEGASSKSKRCGGSKPKRDEK